MAKRAKKKKRRVRKGRNRAAVSAAAKSKSHAAKSRKRKKVAHKTGKRARRNRPAISGPQQSAGSVAAGGGVDSQASNASPEPVTGKNPVIDSLQGFYEYEDFDYEPVEFDTGIDYGEAS